MPGSMQDFKDFCKNYLRFLRNKAKWFAKQLASENLNPRNRTTLPSIEGISHTKDRHKMCGRPKFFKVQEISKFY